MCKRIIIAIDSFIAHARQSIILFNIRMLVMMVATPDLHDLSLSRANVQTQE